LRWRIADARRSRALRAEVDRLAAGGAVAVLNPYLGMDTAAERAIAEDVVDDFVRVYGTRTTREEGRTLLRYPLALLRLPSVHDAYLDGVGPKTRNVIRKAAKSGYVCREFIWNEHLDEIYEVNTSTDTRQGEPMHGWYREPVEPREESPRKKYYGAFRENRLRGYLHLVLSGDFGFVRHFMGHAEHLAGGVMNGLISWTVEQHAGDPTIAWLKYGAFATEAEGMSAFKRHAGFAPYATFLNLPRDR
jgi:hypothetical protein